ncbi:DUF2975 domain-containing protein [Stappia sp. WLB 29]|uniref:DUF2975 domain-containing protein n=1 Tax=Stappia sp. WLB 29 TaxID=2925220 RepID=UPI0020C16F03|nr:DUF2975 domain-containing protein [Stappia sp. WLB 29]
MTSNAKAMAGDNPRLARIVRVSRTMATITLVAAAAVPAALLAVLVFHPPGLDDWLMEALKASSRTVLTPETRIAAMVIAAVPAALGVMVLLLLHRLFLGFARGQILVPASGRILRRIGIVIVALGPLEILLRALASVVLSLPNPPGQREVVVGISSDDITTIISGILLIVLGWTLEEAARIADENRQFV